MTALKQTSWAGGEIAPNLYGRSDLTKWQTGAAILKNFWVNRYGNAENRPGTEFGGNAKNNTKARLIPFVISAAESYVMEMGYSTYGYLRFWKNNQPVTVKFSDQPTWDSTVSYSNGQIVKYLGLAYVSARDNNLDAFPAGPGIGIDWFLLSTVTYSGVEYIIVEIVMPWFAAAIPLIQYAQINDIITFTSSSFEPVRVTYFADNYWHRSGVLSNTVGAPNGVQCSGNVSTTLYRYMVVGLDSDLVTQSIPGLGTGLSISSIAFDGTTATITTPGDYYIYSGEYISLDFPIVDFSAPVDLYVIPAGQLIKVTRTSSTTYTFPVITDVRTNASPGNLFSQFAFILTTPLAVDAAVTITWSKNINASKYNVYRWSDTVWAFIGSTMGATFTDIGITANVGVQPATDIPMFQTSGDWPSVVGIFQQRLWFANTLNQPQSYWASTLGHYGMFTVSTPSNDADGFTYVMAGQQVQFITALVDIGKLIIHTSNGEFVLNGNQAGGVTPTSQNLSRAGVAGSYPGILPVAIGNTDLFVQARGGIIRDLQYNVQQWNYAGKDTTLMSSHLFANDQVVDMAWQQVPNSQVWVVMASGKVLCMTYIKEHDMWAWTQHSTGATDRYESLCIIPEGQHESVYFEVLRTVNGSQQRCIERMWPREFSDIATDACFTDCSLTYDGRNTGPITMTVTTSGGWTPTDVLTITASSSYFVPSDANCFIIMNQVDAYGNITASVSFHVISYVSATVLHALAAVQTTVPTWARATALTTWAKAVQHFSGATQLAGSLISILGDGNVEPQVTVANDGSFDTAQKYQVVHAGLPIAAQFQSLDWENAQGETISNKRKDINELTPIFVQTRGGSYGTDLESTYPFPAAAVAPSDPTYLTTGPIRLTIAGAWQNPMTLFINQNDPLPMCLAAVVPSGEVGQ